MTVAPAPTTPLAPRERSGWTRRVASAAVLAVLLAGALTALAAGARAHSVGSDAMEPALRAGDAVVTMPLVPAHAEAGSIITYPDPQGAGALLTRRVHDVEVAGGIATLETAADGTGQTERWSVAADGRIGRVVLRVPLGGHLVDAVTSAPGRISLLALPALGLAAIALAPRRAGSATP